MYVSQVETNVKLEECLKKVQQENEDYKARMDKHAALSKYVLLLLCVWVTSLSVIQWLHQSLHYAYSLTVSTFYWHAFK